MAIGDPYATLTELKDRVGISVSDTTDDTKLTNALAVATLGIQGVCHRQFNKDVAASARLYKVDRFGGVGIRNECLAVVDDFYTTSGLVIKTDTGGNGTYATTWASTDYQLEPLNGIVDGEPGWPFWEIHAIGSQRFPCSDYQRPAPLQVTVPWGWNAVNANVHEACLIVAEETFKLKDAPFGVAGMGEWGIVRVRANPLAMAMIGKYARDPVLVA